MTYNAAISALEFLEIGILMALVSVKLQIAAKNRQDLIHLLFEAPKLLQKHSLEASLISVSKHQLHSLASYRGRPRHFQVYISHDTSLTQSKLVLLNS